MAKLKIRGGTPQKYAENLCLSCRHAIIRTDGTNQKTIHCNVFDVIIKSNTVECNSYTNANETSIRDMEKIAWHIIPGKHGVMGFKPYKELTKDEKGMLELHSW